MLCPYTKSVCQDFAPEVVHLCQHVFLVLSSTMSALSFCFFSKTKIKFTCCDVPDPFIVHCKLSMLSAIIRLTSNCFHLLWFMKNQFPPQGGLGQTNATKWNYTWLVFHCPHMYRRLYYIKAAVSVGNSPFIVLTFLYIILVEITKDFLKFLNNSYERLSPVLITKFYFTLISCLLLLWSLQ